MVIVFGNFLELRYIKHLRKIIEVEHRLVLAVFAEKRGVFTKVHIFQMVSDKAAIAPLNALAEFADNIVRFVRSHKAEPRF